MIRWLPVEFDAVLTGLSTGRQKVWIAPVGTPAPEQVFDADIMAAAGWRNVGTLNAVLYVEDQAELDRAVEAKTAQTDLEAADAEHAAAAPYMKPEPPLCECGHEWGRHLSSRYACLGAYLAEPCGCEEFAKRTEPAPRDQHGRPLHAGHSEPACAYPDCEQHVVEWTEPEPRSAGLKPHDGTET